MDSQQPQLTPDQEASLRSLRLLSLCRWLRDNPDFHELIQVGEFERRRDETLRALEDCDDSELPKLRQLFVAYKDIASFIKDTIERLEAQGVGMATPEQTLP